MTENYQRHYEALGLAPGAAPEEVKRAYFRLVRKYSPEKEPEQFQKIRQAYEALKDGPKEDVGSRFPVPEDPEIRYLLEQAQRLRAAGKEKAVAECLELALKQAPDDPFLLLHLAHAQQQAGNPRKSARTAQALAKLVPDCREAYVLMGNGYYEGGWYKKALPEYRKAYALGERDSDFLLDYADVLSDNHKTEEADRIRREMLETTKWTRENLDSALYLYARLFGNAPRNEERLLELLDSYGAFFREHRRAYGEGNDALMPVLALAATNSAALRFPAVVVKADALLKEITDVLHPEGEIAEKARCGFALEALDHDRRFSDPWWYDLAILKFDPVLEGAMLRYAVLDAHLCLLKRLDESRREAEILKAEYPSVCEMLGDFIPQLLGDQAESLLEREKRDYARLSERISGGEFYELYPEERSAPRGVVVHMGEEPFVREGKKVDRNDPCPCGSGKKFKKCCQGKGIYD